MKRLSTIAAIGLLAATLSATAQGITPNFPGVPPPVPGPTPMPSPPPSLTIPPSAPLAVPRIDSYSDRTTRCLQSFPLEGGRGNNPSNRDAYVRSCAN